MTAVREAHGISERRACSIIGAVRYRHQRREREGIRRNHKKLRRLYAEERLQVRRHGGRECLNETLLTSLRQARTVLAAWQRD